jgi:Arc/MetJ family transcription regulator
MRKRTNIVVDDELLERARKATGEKTYSGTIAKALEQVVRKDGFREALRRFQEEAAKGDFFWPGYLEEIRPNAYSVVAKKKRVSAHEKRASVSRKERRGSR